MGPKDKRNGPFWQLHFTARDLSSYDNALKTPAKSGDVKRALIILTPNFRIESVQETAWTSLFASDPASKERRCIPVLARQTNLCQHPFLANLKPIDLCGCSSAEAKRCLLAGVSGKGSRPIVEPRFPGDEPAFPPDQPTRKLETGLSDGATAVEPFEVLAALFENPPVSKDELRNICLAALPMPARTQIPSNQSGLALLQWLIGRGALSNGRVPLLDVIATLVPKVGIGQRQRIFDAKAAIAARFGLQSDAGQSMDRAESDDATALLVEIWPVAASAPNRCNAQVRWFQGQTPRCTDVKERDSALRLDEKETVVEFVTKLRQTIGAHRAGNDRLVIEFALPKTHWRTAQAASQHPPFLVGGRLRRFRLLPPDLNVGRSRPMLGSPDRIRRLLSGPVSKRPNRIRKPRP